MDRRKDMGECTYCNSLKISRCNERSSGRAREREQVIIIWKEQEEEENISNRAMDNFANSLPFLQWLEVLAHHLQKVCKSCMRSKSRKRRCSTCRKIGFMKATFTILIKHAILSLCFSLDSFFLINYIYIYIYIF